MPEKIEFLTDAQKSRFKEWEDKWKAIGLSTERMDLGKFTKSARKCYEFAKLNKNVPIIPVPSPIVGALASSISAQMLFNLGKRNNQNINVMRSAVVSAVVSAVDSAVGSAVDSAVGSAVDSAVRS